MATDDSLVSDEIFEQFSDPRAPLIATPPPGPKSREYLEYQRQHESSAVSYPRGLPMAMLRGRGATVEDVDGNVYIDFFGGAGVLNVGHSNPAVLEAARLQMADLTHTLDIPSQARRALVEILRRVLPAELSRLFFGGPTGSDAVESAVKLAKYNTRRIPLIAVEGSYHGMTTGALSLTSAESYRADFLPLLPEVHFLPYAYCYRCAFNKSSESCDLFCAAYLDHKLGDPHSGISKPAAVIIEAVQGEGGTIVPPDGYLSAVRRVCDRHGILLIVDEIQAGFCRTGRMFAFEHSGTLPDIITMSKALGGLGFPISGIAYKEHLNTLPRGKHIGTFRGNVVAYAAGAAAIRFMIDYDLAWHAESLGRTMLEILKGVEKDSPIVGEARGKGLMFGMEFVKDKGSREPAPELAAKVRAFCHSHGLLMELGGHYSNVARFLPPLILTERLARKGLEIFAEAVRAVEKSV
jgi:diaminobutyrate-2-oxoglutarate transaminase